MPTQYARYSADNSTQMKRENRGMYCSAGWSTELWKLHKPCSAEVSVDLREAVGWRSKHQGALNSDKWMHTWTVSANLSMSNNEGRAKALLLSAPESTRSSLKFTTRLLTEGTWQACAEANSQPHTTSCCCLNQGLESHCLRIHNQGSWGCADLWKHTFLSVH